MNVVFKTFMLALLFYSTFVQISVFSLSLKITDEELDKAKQTEHPSTQGPSTSTHEEHTPLREPLTHRMVATTGPSSPRVKEYVTKIRTDKASKTKGVAVSGILKDSKSNFYYPKITTTAGKERSYVLNLFHGKSSAPLSEPNMHMKYPQSDHPSDQGKKASFYQIGHIKIRKSNRETIEKINEHMRNMRHDVFSPKAAMIHYTQANPKAVQKLPTVQVDAGKYDGNLISLVFGESSPRGKRKSPEPVHHSTNDHLQTDGTIDMLSRVGKTHQKTNSPDSKDPDVANTIAFVYVNRMHNTIEALGFTALAAILSQVRPSILRKGQFKWCIRVYKYETYSKHTLSTYSTTIMLSMKFIIISICFTLLSFLNSIKCLTLNIPENKQAYYQAEKSSHGAPTVVTSRMLPTTGPKSPRVINTFHQVKSQGDQKLHSSAYTPILGNGRSDHIYPKISVQSGRKAINVITMFHAEGGTREGVRPYAYLPFQSKELKKDVQNPASLYRLSAAKTKPNDHDSTAVQNHFINMARENKRPKAFSHIKSPADKNAFNKKPIIRMDPGTLNGNLVTLVYAPKKPSHEKKWLQLGLPHNENSLSVHHPSGSHQHSSPTQQSSSSEKSPSRKSTLNLINQMDKQTSRPAKKSRNA